MAERLTIAVEDGTRALLVELAGGERMIGAYVSRLVRDLHAGRLLTQKQMDGERKEIEKYIDERIAQELRSSENAARASDTIKILEKELADTQATRKQLEEVLERTDKVRAWYEEDRERVAALRKELEAEMRGWLEERQRGQNSEAA